MRITNLKNVLVTSAVGLGTAGTVNEAKANVQEQLPQIVKNDQKAPIDKLEDKLYELGIPGPHLPFIVLGIGTLIGLLNMTKLGNYPIIEVKEQSDKSKPEERKS